MTPPAPRCDCNRRDIPHARGGVGCLHSLPASEQRAPVLPPPAPLPEEVEKLIAALTLGEGVGGVMRPDGVEPVWPVCRSELRDFARAVLAQATQQETTLREVAEDYVGRFRNSTMPVGWVPSYNTLIRYVERFEKALASRSAGEEPKA